MGCKVVTVVLPTDYSEEQLKNSIQETLDITEFTYQIESKSLDARKKRNIFWLIKVAVCSNAIKDNEIEELPVLAIDYKPRSAKIIVVGSGPAGLFAAYLLQQSGFNVTLIERGAEVDKRSLQIRTFEKSGVFDPLGNYAFGEGGAGTFSDGKLTSRSKHISKERQYILKKYVESGAPAEIMYMAHPHIGSDNLVNVAKNMRTSFLSMGGEIRFETLFEGIYIEKNRATGIMTSGGDMACDILIIASGQSAFETYRMMMKSGIQFRTKNFALGCRVEHQQSIINIAQWGTEKLPGIKAAEYRLTSPGDKKHAVYTFCMCPGGIVVPATAYPHTNIVNGMSYYNRGGLFANAACVASIHPDELAGENVSPEKALDLIEALESDFFAFSNSYKAPSCTISEFLIRKNPTAEGKSSYMPGLQAAPLRNMLPKQITLAIEAGLRDFCNKIHGYDTGIMLGLESKTSAPVQVVRDPDFRCTGFENIYMAGEGSGLAGGIISSGADGLKVALSILSST